MKALINSLLIIITFIQKIKSLAEFKAIKFDNEKIIVIHKKGIYTFEKNFENPLYHFNSPMIISDTDITNISHFNYLSNIIFTLKDYLFVIFNNFEIKSYNINHFYCQTSFIKTNDKTNFLFTTQCITSDDHFSIKTYKCDTASNKIYYDARNYYKLPLRDKNKISNINCENIKEKTLTCFIGYTFNYIIAYSFTFNSNNIINLDSSKIINNYGKKLSKTISNSFFSSIYSISDTLVCFVDYFTDKNNCIIYNLGYYLLNIKHLFMKETEFNYFLYIFYSSTGFSLIKINKDFGKVESKDYIINKSFIENNLNYYFSPLIYNDNINEIYFLLNSDIDNFNLIKIKAEEVNTNIKNNKPNISTHLLNFQIEQLINTIILGKKYLFIDKDYAINIYSLNKTYNDEINFYYGNCEKKLREANNLNKDNIITIVQVEIYSNNDKRLTNHVKFAMFDENKKKMDLSICDGEEVIINYRLKESDTQKINNFLKDDDITLLNSKLIPFDKDICSFQFLDNEKALNLKNEQRSLYACEINCKYILLDLPNQKIVCKCFSLNSIESEIEEPTFKEKKISSSLSILKCYYIFFSSKIFKSYGFWIFIIALLFRFVLYFFYFTTGIDPILKYVENEMKRYHYDVEEMETLNIHDNQNQPQNNNINSESDRIKNNEDNLENIGKKGENNKNNTILKEENHNRLNQTINNPENINIVTYDIKGEEENKDLKIKNENNESNKDIENLENDKNKENKKDNEIGNKNDNNNINNNSNIDGNQNDSEFFHLIIFDANNTLEKNFPEDPKYIIKDYDLSIEYEKRPFCRLYTLIFINNDFNNAFLFKSSLYLKTIKILLFLRVINDAIFFNALLEDLKYITDNIFLSLFLNVVIISLLAIILSFIISFFIGNLTDCKDDLRELFIEEEKKMIKDENYKVKENRKKEIKMTINDILKKFKIKIIFFFIIDILIWIFSFYYVVIYSIIFSFRQSQFIIASIVSIMEAIPSNALISLVLTIFYKISLKCKSECLFKITTLFI